VTQRGAIEPLEDVRAPHVNDGRQERDEFGEILPIGADGSRRPVAHDREPLEVLLQLTWEVISWTGYEIGPGGLMGV
jgi:hypothetical protein